jgi:hypothetical protein
LVSQTTSKTPTKGIPTRTKILFFVVGWAIVLMPFLFWRATWFGRTLSDSELDQYIHDDAHPRHIQHALVQLGERMTNHDKSATRWYPELVRLANYKVEEIRNTDAWVMGQDTSRPEFHAALLQLLKDSSYGVRSNAALSLVSFGDASGHDQIATMLQPLPITAPVGGPVSEVTKPNALVTKGTLVAKIGDTEVRTPLEGRLHNVGVTNGQQVTSGEPLATLEPGSEQVWEALRALYLIGTPADLDAVRRYERDDPDMPDKVRQQARLTEQAIQKRAGK